MPNRGKKNPKDITVHMIGNAHIDPAWIWRWPEGLEEVMATSQSALDRMEETPEFIYSHSAAITYRWINDYNQTMWKQIERRVKDGHWAVVNGWIVQPDCNIPCGESFVRHGLYGKRYLQSRLGVDVKTGWNVDTFGHCNSLPQILKKCGFDHYIFFRPGTHEKELPEPIFWWESPDGTRLLTCRPPHHYGFWGGEGIGQRAQEAAEQTPRGLKDVLCFYGVGNHGGGPTKLNLQGIAEAQQQADMPTIKYSTVEEFFRRALATRTDYPVVADDLQHHAVGCYTAVSEVKRQNRQCENLLLTSERLSAIAHFNFGRRFPRGEFAFGWENVLFNQFHDILAGSSIRPVYDDANAMYDQARQVAQASLDGALKEIARHIDTEGEGQACVIFNPSSWDRKDPVIAYATFPTRPQRVRVTDPEGNLVMSQIVSTAPADGGYKVGILFIAEVPALGYSVFQIAEGERKDMLQSSLRADHRTLENDLVRVVLADEGTLSSVYDKVSGMEMLANNGNRLVVIDDPSDTWSHGVVGYRDEIGEFEAIKIDLVERGPVRATWRVISLYGDSQVTQHISLYYDRPQIDFDVEVDWHEQRRMLKVAFPVNVSKPLATFETPYANIVRQPTGAEEPGQAWIDVTGIGPRRRKAGASLLNDCKYGFDIKESELRMTILRSPAYCFHDPRQVIPDEPLEWTDQGVQRIGYSLLPHTGGWQDARTVNRAFDFNNPLLPLFVSKRAEPRKQGYGGRVAEPGKEEAPLPKRLSFIRVEPETVILTVAKQGEDSNNLVLRMYEAYGRDGEVTLTVRSPRVSAKRLPIGHYEIKTIEVTTGARPQLREVDMLERPMG